MRKTKQPGRKISRREAIQGVVATVLALGAAGGASASETRLKQAEHQGQTNQRQAGGGTMTIVCVIRYQIDPFQRDAFKKYGENWGRIIPRCGGNLLGYFLPYEGTNDIGWGLISFDSLSSYEAYKARLRADPEARENFAMSQTKKFILREERNFVEVVDGTFGIPAALPPTR